MTLMALGVTGLLSSCLGSAPVQPSTTTQVSASPTRLPTEPSSPPRATPSPEPVGPLPDRVVPIRDDRTVMIGQATIQVELATTSQQYQQGLSGRDVLPKDRGMLFLFPSPGQYSFWMKDMRFPLDIVWISASCWVVDVSAEVPHPSPGTADTELPFYFPVTPAQYVLEINAGEAQRNGIAAGSGFLLIDGMFSSHPCS